MLTLALFDAAEGVRSSDSTPLVAVSIDDGTMTIPATAARSMILRTTTSSCSSRPLLLRTRTTTPAFTAVGILSPAVQRLSAVRRSFAAAPAFLLQKGTHAHTSRARNSNQTELTESILSLSVSLSL
jgi:hypothetical protein